MSVRRSVLHVDMNAFYCACHVAAQPHLYAGKPSAVAGSPETRHGVVVTASYEARALGVRATMTVAEALRVAPQLILIHPDFNLYRSYSRKVFDVVRTYTPAVEIFSIDECWADVSGSSQFGTPAEIGQKLQARLLSELGIPCSVGVSANKFLAKMASDFRKPMGLTELWPEHVPHLLWPLPIRQMFGIGDKSAQRLERLGIHTIGQVASADIHLLRRHFGRRGEEWSALAAGRDDSPVTAQVEQSKSIGHSMTLGRDLSDMEGLCTVLLNLSDQVGRRVRRHALVGRTVQLTVRYATRETITRSKTLPAPTDLTEVIYETAVQLLRTNWRKGNRIRLLGVTVSQLGSPQPNTASFDSGVQLQLFDDDPMPTSPEPKPKDLTKLKRLATATDALRDKFGEDIIIRGRMLTDPESGQIRDRKIRGTSLQKDWLHDN